MDCESQRLFLKGAHQLFTPIETVAQYPKIYLPLKEMTIHTLADLIVVSREELLEFGISPVCIEQLIKRVFRVFRRVIGTIKSLYEGSSDSARRNWEDLLVYNTFLNGSLGARAEKQMSNHFFGVQEDFVINREIKGEVLCLS